jgi:hypothetical protein
MNWTIVKDSGIRAARTFFQTALAVFLASVGSAATLGELTAWRVIEPAIIAGVIAMLMSVLELLKGVTYNRG